MSSLLHAAAAPTVDLSRVNLFGCTLAELEERMASWKLPRFRATQLFAALFARRVRSFDAMTDLSKPLRQSFAERFCLDLPRVDQCQVSRDGTRKYRYLAADGSAFEAVYLPEVGGENTNTLCISSQTGCSVGCKFCFTASIKRNRNLSAAEIVGQVVAVQRDVEPLGDGARLTNIVFMGMGEPLLNFAQVTDAMRILLHPLGMAFSSRRLTVSTSGIVPRLRELGDLARSGELPIQLAISLNASDDVTRTRIMPINKKWPLAELLDAARAYPLRPRRAITMEYVLLGGINDSDEDARRLPGLLQGLTCKLNLLPLNPHDETPFLPPTAARVASFQGILRRAGMHALVRTPRGQDIAAACGQLGEAV